MTTTARRSFLKAVHLELHATKAPSCPACSAPWDHRRHKPSIDHITPLRHGGTNDRANLRAICLRCNIRKGATPEAT